MARRSLLLLRHGKSSWSDASLSDYDRPLKKRGCRNACEMGSYLFENALVPEKILCSTAARAIQTHEHLVTGLQSDPPTQWVKALYHASPAILQQILHTQPDELQVLMVIGHNPGLEEFLELYAPGFHSTANKKAFPTACLALLQSDMPFDQWQPGADVSLESIIRPRDLPDIHPLPGAPS